MIFDGVRKVFLLDIILYIILVLGFLIVLFTGSGVIFIMMFDRFSFVMVFCLCFGLFYRLMFIGMLNWFWFLNGIILKFG